MNSVVKRSSWHYRLAAHVYGGPELEVYSSDALGYWLKVLNVSLMVVGGVIVATIVVSLYAKLLWAMPILTMLASGILAAVALVRFQPDSWLSAALETAWTPISLGLRVTGVSDKLAGIPAAAKNAVVAKWNELFPPITFVE